MAYLDDVGLESLGDGRDVNFSVVLARLLHGSVVDKDIELAKDLDVLVDGGLAVSLLLEVVLHAVTLTTSLFNLLDGVLCVLLFFGQIQDRDVGTFSGHEDSDGATDAAITTGDENSLVLEETSALVLLEVGLAIVVPVFKLCPVGLLLHVLVETRAALLVLG